jgi:hypothetical protein
VDRARSQTGHGAQAGVSLRWILVGLSDAACDPLASGLAGLLSRFVEPQSRGEPAPEPRQELAAPAPKASPAPPDRALVHLESEPRAHLVLGLAVDEVEPECLEDHRSGVPAARIEQVGQNADRLLAAPAEVAPDRDLVLLSGHDDSENLAPVNAVPHDPESVGPERQVAAAGARPRPQLRDAREPSTKIEQLVDGFRHRQ